MNEWMSKQIENLSLFPYLSSILIWLILGSVSAHPLRCGTPSVQKLIQKGLEMLRLLSEILEYTELLLCWFNSVIFFSFWIKIFFGPFISIRMPEFFFFFFKELVIFWNSFMYLFIFGCAGPLLLHRVTPCCCEQVFHCGGPSHCKAQALGYGLRSCSSWAPEHSLTSWGHWA